MWVKLDIFDALEVCILRPKNRMVRHSSSQNNRVCHCQAAFQCDLGGIEGEGGVKVDDPTLYHVSNYLDGGGLAALLKDPLEYFKNGQ